jgi:hypothetical protein
MAWPLLLIAVLALLTGTTTISAAQSADSAELQLLPQPRRLVDTQPGSGFQGAGQPLDGLTTPRCYQVAGQVGVPANADGVVANLTAVGFSVDGWITLFPAGNPIPDTSNVNFDTDQLAVANLAMVPLGGNGQLCAVGQTGTHLILDVVGYFQSTAPVVGLTCPDTHTLEALQACIVDQSGMPNRTGAYVIPNDAERIDFRSAVRAMLTGPCTSVTLSDSPPHHRVRSFTDESTASSTAS